jgi:hypothetical protein
VSAVTDRWSDEELLTALRQVFDARLAVPPEFVETGKNAFAWHNIDAELAQLTYDSILAGDQAARTRAETASIRALTFTSAHLTIELEVAGESLLGQVIPVHAATIEVHTSTGADLTTLADEIGCFAIRPIPRSPFRLRCRAAAGLDVLTGWITL